MFHADLQKSGYRLFRHEQLTVDEDLRNVTYGCRFVSMDNKTGDVKTDKHGDFQFMHFYEPKKGKRRIGSWAQASPGIVKDSGVVPIKDDKIEADDRYEPADFTSVVSGDIPGGVPGVVLGASDEETEYKLFFPANVLIAHQAQNAPPKFSSLVHDIDGDELDKERRAGLHSTMWVKRLPSQGVFNFQDDYALAWNLTQSTGDRTGYGLFTAPADRQPPRPFVVSGRGSVVRRTRKPRKDILAMASWAMSGPFHPGHEDDQHRIGVNKDGEALNAAHIHTGAYFYNDQLRDGPMDFELDPYPQVTDAGLPVAVHLRFDENPLHDFVGGSRRGRWRWFTRSPFFFLDPPSPPRRPPLQDIPPTGPPPFVPIPPVPPVGPPKPPGSPGTPVPNPFDDTPRDFFPFDPKQGEDGFKGVPDDVGRRTGQGDFVPTPGFETRIDQRQPQPLAATYMKTALPAIALQAHPARTTTVREKHRSNPNPKFIDKVKNRYPIVAQIEAFGEEPAPGVMTRDSGRRVYQPGTGPGSIALFPPQTGTRDQASDFNPQGVTLSTVDLVLFREKVGLFWGTPDVTKGEGVNGFRTFLNSGGSLQSNGIDSSGDSDESKFFLMNHSATVQGTTAPNFWIWNTDTTSADEDSGYLLLAGRTASSARTMRLRMSHPQTSIQAVEISDGTTAVGYFDEDGTLYQRERSSSPSALANFGQTYAKTDGNLYFLNDGGTEYQLNTAASGLSTGLNSVQDFRLTGSSGNPVSGDLGGTFSTLYCTPYVGNRIALYDGSSTWEVFTSAEFSIALPTPGTNSLYDVFVYDNSGTPTLELLVWTSAGEGTSARATALTYQDGVYVKTGDTTRRYLGTIYVDTAGNSQFDLDNKYLWNYYNRIELTLIDSQSLTHTYTSGTVRRWGGGAGTVSGDMCIGIAEECGGTVSISHDADFAAGDSAWSVAYGLNNSAAPALSGTAHQFSTTSGTHRQIHSFTQDLPLVDGYNFCQPVQASGATSSTFYGIVQTLKYWG